MPKTIRVGMAGLDIAKSPDEIETLALGSCVGVVLYDGRAKIGGISHAMLPDINEAREASRGNLGKFVNTAVEELIDKMERHGANRRYIKAKLAGGANMFPNLSNEGTQHIGERNIEAARGKLNEIDIPIEAEEVGGTFGRTIILNSITGKVTVRTAAKPLKEI